MSKKQVKPKNHHGSIAWFNMNYWMLNGLLLPSLAYTAICDLVNLGRVSSLDGAIREGLRMVIEENTPLLVRSDRKWIRYLSRMDEAFRETKREKPDNAGAENLRFLNKMYEARAKFENKLNR